MGYKQGLDNGVMDKPTTPITNSRSSKSMNFYNAIANGENSNGQTTIAPAEVVRDGQNQGYEQWGCGGTTDGNRWNGNPVLNKKREW